jgi:serine/threonine-protein kinase ATR
MCTLPRRLSFAYSSRLGFEDQDVAAAWLASSRIARKANNLNIAHDFTMRAAMLGSPAARLEQCRLLWKGGSLQKAMQTLKSTLEDKSFGIITQSIKGNSSSATGQENFLLAKTKLRLVRWIDQSGTQREGAIRTQYADVARLCSRSDKGHYYLGCHYNQLLESEKSKPEEGQSGPFRHGDNAKLVIDNYLRSMMYGAKYLYRTVPKVFTLWLDFGRDQVSRRTGLSQLRSQKKRQEEQLLEARERVLRGIHVQLEKYFLDRVQPYVLYTAFPQMLSRIDHPEPNVAELLRNLIVRVTSRHPRQALWSLFAVKRSSSESKKKMAQMALQALNTVKVSEIGEFEGTC